MSSVVGMETFPLVITMYALSAALPVLRLGVMGLKAGKASRAFNSAAPTVTGEGVSFAQFNVLIARFGKEEKARVWSSFWDVMFVGGGTALGAIASIITLQP